MLINILYMISTIKWSILAVFSPQDQMCMMTLAHRTSSTVCSLCLMSVLIKAANTIIFLLDRLFVKCSQTVSQSQKQHNHSESNPN